MTDTEKDARIAELEQRIKDIAESLTFAPDSAHWSARLRELLGTSEPVDVLQRRLTEEHERGRRYAVNNIVSMLTIMQGGAS